MIVWPAGVITENRASFSGSAADSVSANASGSRTDVILKSVRISGLYSSAAFLSCSGRNQAAALQARLCFRREGVSEGFPVLLLPSSETQEHEATF